MGRLFYFHSRTFSHTAPQLMLDTLTETTADETTAQGEKPEYVRPVHDPDVVGIKRQLREVREEIKTLEAKREQSQERRRWIEREQRQAREAEDYERLSELTVEQNEVEALSEDERNELLDLHRRAMELQEQKDDARAAAAREIEDRIEKWADPRMQALANACRLVLDLSAELMPPLKEVRDHNLRTRRFEESDAAAVRPDVPLKMYSSNLLGERGHLQSLLQRLQRAGYEPE